MHGSFTPDSAEKFLELMREAGYETSALPDSDGLQTFSELGINPGATQGDVWSGNVADFGEVRGEYIENYDYTRCVRPNGTAYGTGGTCRKGTPEEKEEHDALSQLQQMLPKGEKIVTSSGGVFGKEPKASSKSLGETATAPVPPKPIKDPVPGILRSQAEVKGIIADRPETPNAIRDEMGRPLKLSSDRLKALSQDDLETEWNRAKTTSRKDSLRKEIDRREAEGKLGKLKSDLLETSNKIDEIVKGGGKVGLNDPLSKKLKEQAAAIAGLKKTMNFSEGAEGSYDFTRCVRPDGSAYGTRGKCKKGTEAGAKQEAPAKGRGGVIDRDGQKCEKCGKGTYKIADLNDELNGERHCNKCGHFVTRYDKSLKLEADRKGTEATKVDKIVQEVKGQGEKKDRDRNAAIDRISREKGVSSRKAGSEADKMRLKELDDEIKSLQSMTDKARENGFRDRAVDYSKRTSKLIQERADLRTKLEVGKKGTDPVAGLREQVRAGQTARDKADRQKNISDAKAEVKEIENEIKTRGPHTREEKAYLANQLRMARNRLDRFETGKMMTREEFQAGVKKMGK